MIGKKSNHTSSLVWFSGSVWFLLTPSDAYNDPRDCEVGGTRTVFNAKGLRRLTDDMSNRCLKFYNQKNSKNFNLEEVVKFNFLQCEFYCMTFRAREAESNECHYFRGVVYSFARRDVLLCEIKGFLHPMDTYYAGIRRTTTEYIHVESLRDMCDDYFDPHLCEVGGTRTIFNAKGLHVTKDMSNQCLELYNQKNNKNFILEEVVKLNVLPSEFYCMAFRARDAESAESHLFRGVVYSLAGIDDVLLCEIKDDGEILIPAEHDESYDPMSAESIYDTCYDDDDLLTAGSADVDRGSDAGLGDGLVVGSADVNRGSAVGFGDGLSVGSIDVNCGSDVSDVGSIGVPGAP